MADDKSKRGHARLASDQDDEVKHFAQHNGITADQAPELIKANDNDRAGITEATKALREAAGRSRLGGQREPPAKNTNASRQKQKVIRQTK
jgi:hypothetical protein